jgi:hypothetical protein
MAQYWHYDERIYVSCDILVRHGTIAFVYNSPQVVIVEASELQPIGDQLRAAEFVAIIVSCMLRSLHNSAERVWEQNA